MNGLKIALRHAVCSVKSMYAFVRYCICGRKARFLLLDTPEHGNLGDQAIALAQIQLLDALFGKGSYYEVTANEVEGWEKSFASVTPMNQIILVHGGGFLGALWLEEEHRFRRILKAYGNHKVIVFPQTVTFDMESVQGHSLYEESRRVYASHPDLTICCRERKSLAFMEHFFPEVRPILVPDSVLFLDAEVGDFEREGVLFCLRSDKEKSLGSDELARIRRCVREFLPQASMHETDTVVPRRIPSSRRKKEVMSKLREFSRAQLVVTDRLHGMVFAAIVGTPCLAFDNANGKVSAVWEWISDLDYVACPRSGIEISEALLCMGLGKPHKYDSRGLVECRDRLLSALALETE